MKNNYKGKIKMKKGEFFLSYNAIIESINKYTGKVVKRTVIHNLIVNTGLNLVRNWMAGDSVDNPQAIAIGLDDTAVDNTDAQLGNELTRETATISKPNDYEVRYAYEFSVGSGESYDIKEVGVFDSDILTGSTMLARLICDNPLDTDTNLSIAITYTLARV